jgi:DNA modification methylase
LTGVDACITDPPYGIEGGSGTINLQRAKGSYLTAFSDSPDYIRNVVVPVICNCIEIAPTVVVTPGNKNMMRYPQPDSFGCFYQPASVGLQVFGNADAQPIFYYGKNGTRKNCGKPCSYILTESPTPNGHPCPKPQDVWTRLVVNTTADDCTILDPFAGSGTTGVACIRTGCKSILIELERKYCDIIVQRLERELSQPCLPTLEPSAIKQSEML